MAVRGHVDGMIGAYVSGWARAESDQGDCEISVSTMEGEVLAKGRACRHRADLAVLGLGSTAFGFRIPVDNPPERRRLRVHANGIELAGSPLATGGGMFDSECAIAGGVVSGWITERVTAFEPPLITIQDQHGTIMGEGRAVLDTVEIDRLAAKALFKVDLALRCFGAGEMRLSVLANGVRISERLCNLRLAGNLETITTERCAGWLLSPDQPQRSLSIEVYRGGVLAGTAICDMSREDVRGQHPLCAAPGFSLDLPLPTHELLGAVTLSLRLPGSNLELFKGPYVLGGRPAAVAAAQRAARLAYQGLPGIGVAERAVLQLALSDFLAKTRNNTGFIASRQPDPMLPRSAGPRSAGPRLTIIVPVYRNLELTRACILSVLAHRDPARDHLVLINDASPEPDMAKVLRGFTSQPGVFLMTNDRNAGFIRTVNRGLGFAGGGDVLLLNADTVLFAGSLDELCGVAAAAAEIGTVTAMSNNATIFSYPHPTIRKEKLPDIGWAELAAAALSANAGVAVEVPTGHGFCMLIKGEVLRRIGLLDEEFGRGYGEENDLCQRAADLGYRHVAAAGVIVEHRESVSFNSEKTSLLAANLPRLEELYPEFTPTIMEFERQDGLRRARWGLDELRLGRAVAAGASFVLVVSNRHDGGMMKASRGIERAADDYGGAAELCLRVRADGFVELLCAAPALRATFAPDEVEPLFRLLSRAAPARVLVHQLLGYSAGFIERLGAWAAALHSVFYIHDFYAICPRVTMIDAVGRFCDVADAPTCARCMALAGGHETSKLNGLTPAEHRALFGGLLGGFRHVVAPSNDTAHYLGRVFPELVVQAVPHPEPAAEEAAGVRGGNDDEIVLLGAIGPHKGSAKLLEIAQRARLTHPRLRFRVIGFTDIDRQLTAAGNVTVTGRYTPEQLPGLIGQARGRLALFLHIWPETYSYTLSEAAQFGFIPLVPDIGAPADRVRAARFGVVFPFPIAADQVLEVIEGVLTGRIAPGAPGAGPELLFPAAEELVRTRRILGIEDIPADASAAVEA